MPNEKNPLLLPSTADAVAAAPSRRSTYTLRHFLLIAGCLLTCLLFASSLRSEPSTFLSVSPQHGYDCPQPDPAPLSKLTKSLLSSSSFRSEAIKTLQGAVQIPTISYDDFRDPEEDDRWSPFGDLHAHFHTSFPLLYAQAEVETLSTYSLLFVLRGSDETLKPTLLAGHQDVVPVENPEEWRYPPFDAVVDEHGWMWGRGTTDTKAVTVGVLVAIERMLANGWKPKRTVVIASGQDEEVRGRRGSRALAKRLEELFGRDGVAVVLDEGATGFEAYGRSFNLVSIAEKGYADLSIEVRSPASHSSMPAEENAISILSYLVNAYQVAPALAPPLESDSPVAKTMTCFARHGKDVPSWMSKALRNGDMRALHRGVAHSPYAIMQQTSKTPTILQAGEKVNVVPPSARANFNHRLAIGTSLSELNASVWRAIEPTVEELKKRVAFELSIDWHDAEEASAVSSPDSPAWSALASAERAVLPDVVVTPFSIYGYTDVRRYASLSRNIYRHAPARPGSRLGPHGTDERTHVDGFIDAILVYIEFILAMEQLSDEGM